MELYESTTKSDRRARLLRLLMLLALMILTHGFQMMMGVEVLMRDVSVWKWAIGLCYTVVNASVVATQAHLVLRAVRFTLRAPFPRVVRNYGSRDEGEGFATVVTWGGQIAFGLIYFRVI